MSAHTEGRLKARAWSNHAETTIVRDDLAGPVEAVAECSGFGRASEHCEANARRLVACWNACEGVSTETLECLKDFQRQSAMQSLQATLAERDELIEALRAAKQFVTGRMKLLCRPDEGARDCLNRNRDELAARINVLLAKYPVPE